MGVGRGELPGLISGGRKASISKDLIRTIKAGKVAYLSKDHGTHAIL